MSNPRYNSQTANTREGSNQKMGSYGRGQNNIPTAVEAAAVYCHQEQHHYEQQQ